MSRVVVLTFSSKEAALMAHEEATRLGLVPSQLISCSFTMPLAQDHAPLDALAVWLVEHCAGEDSFYWCAVETKEHKHE